MAGNHCRSPSVWSATMKKDQHLFRPFTETEIQLVLNPVKKMLNLAMTRENKQNKLSPRYNFPPVGFIKIQKLVYIV